MAWKTKTLRPRAAAGSQGQEGSRGWPFPLASFRTGRTRRAEDGRGRWGTSEEVGLEWWSGSSWSERWNDGQAMQQLAYDVLLSYLKMTRDQTLQRSVNSGFVPIWPFGFGFFSNCSPFRLENFNLPLHLGDFHVKWFRWNFHDVCI